MSFYIEMNGVNCTKQTNKQREPVGMHSLSGNVSIFSLYTDVTTYLAYLI